MFRFAFAVLAAMALAALFFGAASVAVVGIGSLLLVPIIFVMKIVLFFMLFGFIARTVSAKSYRSGSYRGWCGRPRERTERPSWAAPVDIDDKPADGERFDEWHRMAHARKEVDSWVDIGDENA